MIFVSFPCDGHENYSKPPAFPSEKPFGISSTVPVASIFKSTKLKKSCRFSLDLKNIFLE